MNKYDSSYTGLHNDGYEPRIKTLEDQTLDNRLSILENFSTTATNRLNTLETWRTNTNIDNVVGGINSPVYANSGVITACEGKALDIYTGTFGSTSWVLTNQNGEVIEDISTYEQKWYCEFFPATAVNATSYDLLKNETPRTDIAPRYTVMHSTTSGNLFNVHTYVCRATSYLYCPTDMTIIFSWACDDEGACWVNDTFLGLNASCAWSSSYTLNLHQGYNEFIIIYHEGTGGEWFITSPKIHTYKQATLLGIPGVGYQQTIHPVSINNNRVNSNTALFNPSVQNGSYQNVLDLNKILEVGTVTCGDNNEITVKIFDMTKPESDLTINWLAYNMPAATTAVSGL